MKLIPNVVLQSLSTWHDDPFAGAQLPRIHVYPLLHSSFLVHFPPTPPAPAPPILQNPSLQISPPLQSV